MSYLLGDGVADEMKDYVAHAVEKAKTELRGEIEGVRAEHRTDFGALRELLRKALDLVDHIAATP